MHQVIRNILLLSFQKVLIFLLQLRLLLFRWFYHCKATDTDTATKISMTIIVIMSAIKVIPRFCLFFFIFKSSYFFTGGRGRPPLHIHLIRAIKIAPTFKRKNAKDRFSYPSLAYILYSNINKAPVMPFLTFNKFFFVFCKI